MHYLFRADLINSPNWLLVVEKFPGAVDGDTIDTGISVTKRFSWRVDGVDKHTLLVWDNPEPLASYNAKVCVTLPGLGEDTSGCSFGPAVDGLIYQESPLRFIAATDKVERRESERRAEPDPNDRQVGGDHYKKAKFQPWDWPLYLVDAWSYSIVKYTTRFKEKSGTQDLEKAVHFADKLLWAVKTWGFSQNNIVQIRQVDDYLQQNQCDKYQRRVIHAALIWKSSADVEHLKQCLQDLIADHTEHEDDISTYF